MTKAVACVMYGLGGSIFDPPGGEVALINKIKALGVDTAESPYQYYDTAKIANVLIAAHAQGTKAIIGGDSLGANNGPVVAQSIRTKMGIDYLFGFQPSEYGIHQPLARNIIEGRCIYNPDFVETMGLGAYEWVRENGNTRTILHITTAYDMHPGDNDIAMQNLVLADIHRIVG